jgi:hypothetical protein
MATNQQPDAVAILAEIRARGMEVRVSPDDSHVQYRPVSAMPLELARRLHAHRWEVMALLYVHDPEVIWRMVALLPQVSASGAIGHLLARPKAGSTSMLRHCATCGDPLAKGRRYRCVPCQHAAWLVLTMLEVAEEIAACQSRQYSTVGAERKTVKDASIA